LNTSAAFARSQLR